MKATHSHPTRPGTPCWCCVFNTDHLRAWVIAGAFPVVFRCMNKWMNVSGVRCLTFLSYCVLNCKVTLNPLINIGEKIKSAQCLSSRCSRWCPPIHPKQMTSVWLQRRTTDQLLEPEWDSCMLTLWVPYSKKKHLNLLKLSVSCCCYNKYYELSGLKQQVIMVWRLDVSLRKTKAPFFSGDLRGDPFPSIPGFQSPVLLGMALPSVCVMHLALHLPLWLSCYPPSTLRILVMTLEPMPIIQDLFLISRALVWSYLPGSFWM